MRRWMIFLMVCLLLCPPALGEGWVVEEDEAELPPDRLAQARLLMQRMTLEEKVWQMMIVSPEALTGEKITSKLGDANVFKARPAGGVVIFGQNIVSESQLKKLTAALLTQAQTADAYPPFLAVSEEGGANSRVANKLGYPQAPSAAELGGAKDTALAFQAGGQIAAYLKPFGITLDFAPLCDIQTAEDSWIAKRVYGSSADTVSARAQEMARGLRSQGVIPCFSHFPGQGSINGNLNNREVINTRSLEDMRKEDWAPFRQAIQDGAEMIMVSNAPCRAAGDGMPSCLSSVVIGQWLRGELGFEGVVVTDALRMGAITSLYKPGTAAVAAVRAGADMLLLPANADTAAQAVLKAVAAGEITRARIEESVERILALKIEKGIIR